MKETGIIMSGDHPKKIIDLIKTMTRRTYGLEFINLNPDAYKFLRMEGDLAVFEQIGFTKLEVETHPSKPSYLTKTFIEYIRDEGGDLQFYVKCPYGQVGDRLWVRETWGIQDFAICVHGSKPSYRGKDGWSHPVIYKAGTENYAWGLTGEPKWKPSIHLTKYNSRITLEITEVRAERVQEITGQDCKAEGCSLTGELFMSDWDEQRVLIKKYTRLWDSLNAKRGYGWNFNPWVFPISFKVVK